MLAMTCQYGYAQSNPNWSFGFVPSPALWNHWFGIKQDILGFTPCNTNGCTMLGEFNLTPATGVQSGFNIGIGQAPVTPKNGDMWGTINGLFFYVNNTVIGPFSASNSSGTFTSTAPLTVSTIGLVTNYAIANGTSVANPGTGFLESLLPVQTVTGSGKTFLTADLFKKTRRSNAGAAMNDTFPPSTATGMVNGTRIVVSNNDTTASLTIAAGVGTSMPAGATDVIAPGRDVAYEYDLPNATWRGAFNTRSALLSPLTLAQFPSLPANTAMSNWTNAPGTPLSNVYPSCPDSAGSHLNYVNGVGLTCGATSSPPGTATIPANSSPSNWTGSTALPSNNTYPSCPDSAGSHLNYVNGTGLTCGTTASSSPPQSFVPPPQGRLTISNGTPVMLSNVASSATVYYTPYNGNNIPLWNGSAFVPIAFSQLTNALGSSSVGNAGPAATVPNALYDLFVWNNAGTPTLTRGPAWTNSTSRSNNLTRINGIFTNNLAITNGPGVATGTYVGTVLTDTTDGNVTFITSNSSTTPNINVQVWNMYNRISTTFRVVNIGPTYTYGGSALRECGSSANLFVNVLVGIVEDSFVSDLTSFATAPSVLGSYAFRGIVKDSISTVYSNSSIYQTTGSGGNTVSLTTTLQSMPSNIGLTPLFCAENGDGTDAFIFNSNLNDRFEVAYPD